MIYFQYSVLVVVLFWLAWFLVCLGYDIKRYRNSPFTGADRVLEPLFAVSVTLLILGGVLVWIY